MLDGELFKLDLIKRRAAREHGGAERFDACRYRHCFERLAPRKRGGFNGFKRAVERQAHVRQSRAGAESRSSYRFERIGQNNA